MHPKRNNPPPAPPPKKKKRKQAGLDTRLTAERYPWAIRAIRSEPRKTQPSSRPKVSQTGDLRQGRQEAWAARARTPSIAGFGDSGDVGSTEKPRTAGQAGAALAASTSNLAALFGTLTRASPIEAFDRFCPLGLVHQCDEKAFKPLGHETDSSWMTTQTGPDEPPASSASAPAQEVGAPILDPVEAQTPGTAWKLAAALPTPASTL